MCVFYKYISRFVSIVFQLRPRTLRHNPDIVLVSLKLQKQRTMQAWGPLKGNVSAPKALQGSETALMEETSNELVQYLSKRGQLTCSPCKLMIVDKKSQTGITELVAIPGDTASLLVDM